jgi:hypothetical protein
MKKMLLFFLLLTGFQYITLPYSDDNVNSEVIVIRKAIEVRPGYFKTYNYQIQVLKNQILKHNTVVVKKLVLFNNNINMNLVFYKEGFVCIRLYNIFGNLVQSEKSYVKPGFSDLFLKTQDFSNKILYLTIEQDSEIVLSKLILNY